MCGINGFVSAKLLSREELSRNIERMNTCISHRGPDDEGLFVYDNIGLGHVRLSILDLSASGHQPMQYENLVITYNGEIYNYREIRSELIQLGHTFVSGTDTEVILHAFREWNTKCIERFTGMFAFCIYNKDSRKAWIVRDRLGIKPLYIYFRDGLLVFSSELKAIESTPGVKLTLNKDIIPIYLTLLYTPENHTPYNEIQKLPPGSCWELDARILHIKPSTYWSIDNISHSAPSAENPWSCVRETITKAVDQILVSDVPVGLWLSGGVDSGLIAGITSRELGVQLETFSITYPEKFGLYDESERARTIATHFKHHHTELEIDPVRIFDNFDEILRCQEEWIGSPASVLYYHLSEKTVRHVKVALSGLGGDEVFGGYNRYRALEWATRLNKLPGILTGLAAWAASILPQSRLDRTGNYGRAINKIFSSLDNDNLLTYSRMVSYLPAEKAERIRDMMNNTGDIMNDVMRFDIKNYMVEDLLLLSDKMSMAHGLEIRVPLIEYKIVESAFSTPASNRMGRAGSKSYLRNWFDGYMESRLPQSRKMGFSVPVEPFLRKLGKQELNLYFTQAELGEFLEKQEIIKTLDSFFSGSKDTVNEIYALLVLAKWRLAHNI